LLWHRPPAREAGADVLDGDEPNGGELLVVLRVVDGPAWSRCETPFGKKSTAEGETTAATGAQRIQPTRTAK
jgi:hypothetical protein